MAISLAGAVPADVVDRLTSHPWPGNVRQLAQTIQRIYIFEDRVDRVLDDLFGTGSTDPAAPHALRALPPAAAPVPVETAASIVAPAAPPEPILPLYNLDELRRLAVRQALTSTDGHRGKAAELLGVSLNTMTRLVAECCPEIAAKAGRKRAVKPR